MILPTGILPRSRRCCANTTSSWSRTMSSATSAAPAACGAARLWQPAGHDHLRKGAGRPHRRRRLSRHLTRAQARLTIRLGQLRDVAERLQPADQGDHVRRPPPPHHRACHRFELRLQSAALAGHVRRGTAGIVAPGDAAAGALVVIASNRQAWIGRGYVARHRAGPSDIGLNARRRNSALRLNGETVSTAERKFIGSNVSALSGRRQEWDTREIACAPIVLCRQSTPACRFAVAGPPPVPAWCCTDDRRPRGGCRYGRPQLG